MVYCPQWSPEGEASRHRQRRSRFCSPHQMPLIEPTEPPGQPPTASHVILPPSQFHALYVKKHSPLHAEPVETRKATDRQRTQGPACRHHRRTIARRTSLAVCLVVRRSRVRNLGTRLTQTADLSHHISKSGNDSVVALIHLVADFPDRLRLLRHRTVKVPLGDRRIKYPAQPALHSHRNICHRDDVSCILRKPDTSSTAVSINVKPAVVNWRTQGRRKQPRLEICAHAVQGPHRGSSAGIAVLWRRVAKQPRRLAPAQHRRLSISPTPAAGFAAGAGYPEFRPRYRLGAAGTASKARTTRLATSSRRVAAAGLHFCPTPTETILRLPIRSAGDGQCRHPGNSAARETRDQTGPSDHSVGMMPSRMAITTASSRLDAPNLRLRFSMCFRTVYQLTPSSSAMYFVSHPNAR